MVAYRNSFLWNYAKKHKVPYSSRSVKMPEAVRAKNTKGKIQISWKKNEDASGYVIYRGASRNGVFSKVGQVKKAFRVTWTDKRVVKGKTYFYKVRAYRVVAKARIYSRDSRTVRKKR